MKKVIIGARVASCPNASPERREGRPRRPPLINAATTVSACPVDEKRQKLANYPTAEGEWKSEEEEARWAAARRMRFSPETNKDEASEAEIERVSEFECVCGRG